MIFRCLNQIRLFSTRVKQVEIMKYLCVAEKNDAAKTISGFLSLGRSQRREGMSKFNKIYEFDMNFRGQQSKIVFTSVSGHLLNFDFSSAYTGWQSCNPEQLFDAPVIKFCPEKYVKIKLTLEREIRTCNGLIIWTDCDREGENIGYEIIDVCKAIKPNISIHRAKFSDMTSASVHRAINNLIQPDERISNAVDVRSELDLRIGAAFTRFQTLRLQGVFPNNIENLVSYGSCQIPTLGFVVQRYKEIEKFISRAFWKIKLTHKIEKLLVEFNWARSRLFDKPCVEAFLMICQADGQALITNVLQKPKNKWRPQPLDTVELEKTGSRKLKLTAKEIMTIAERLYTQGLISYPRTETNIFPKDINLRPLVEMQVEHPEWGQFANRVLEWGTNPRNGNKSDQAHPPIHPTKYSCSLQGNEKRVYELVCRHFLACVSRDAVGSETVVSATIGKEDFTATGLMILERNYLDVYIYERWSGKEIHHYEVGHTFRPTELSLHEGATNPPAMLTEADLIALMEKHGIGTDATHAEHIATVTERGYIGVIEQGHLVPGTLGMGLVEGYELMNLQLAQPRLRAGLEEDLKAICDGLKNPREVLAEQIQKYKECYQIISREARSLDQALGQRFGLQPEEAPRMEQVEMSELFKCPKCQIAKMAIKQKKDNTGFFISCQSYPQCKNAIWLTNEVKDITIFDEVCQGCGGENKKVKIKFNPISMLGFVDENPAYSRIEGTHYITCLMCDDKVRSLLNIRADTVKVLGNIVGAATRPIHQNQPTNRPALQNQATNRHAQQNQQANRPIEQNQPINRPAQQNLPTNRSAQQSLPRNPRDPPSRSFSNRATNNDSYQSRGWNNDDDDDDRPAGGGAAIAAGNNSRNQEWNNNQNRGWNDNQNRGWNDGAGSSNSTTTKKPRFNLKKLPDVNCKCNKVAAKYITTKEGPNTGRPFYSCSERICKFFQWGDEQPQVQQQLNAPSTSSAGPSTVSTGARRKCGICKQEGHNKLKCPNLTNNR